MTHRVFLSYPRVADERGAVTDIRIHLQRELQIMTGDRDILVFQDRTGIKGGDRWSALLEAELREASVLVLFLCPLWLNSPWCVKELRYYVEYGLERGADRPVIPLLWEKTEARHARTEEQRAILPWVQSRQAVDWQTLRHEDSSYKGYRRALGAFAEAVAATLSAE